MKPLSFSCLDVRKSLRYGLLALLLSAAPLGQANAAISISDVYTVDVNLILATDNSIPDVLQVTESYGETTRIPYTSHDGYGIVNSSHQYFDKVVTYTDAANGTTASIQFIVSNATPYDWSDYHIELWDSSFTTRLTTVSLSDYSTDQFANKNYTDGVVSFYAPGSHESGETGLYSISTELFDVSGAAAGSFGIRQVATTVPEPASMALIGIGLAGLLGYRRANREDSVA